jgi:hypothetical protein
MKRFYLVAAIVGAIVPYVFFIQYMGAEGMSVSGFLAAIFANSAASGIAADALIASVVFWAFMIHRNRYSHGPSPLIFVALNLMIGLSCALPAYLFAQELGRKHT